MSIRARGAHRRSAILLGATLAIVAVDAVWIAAASLRRAPPAPFQRATSGVGLGPAVSGAWSLFGFDARTQARCENEEWPLPGSACPNPYHGASLIDAPPLTRRAARRE